MNLTSNTLLRSGLGLCASLWIAGCGAASTENSQVDPESLGASASKAQPADKNFEIYRSGNGFLVEMYGDAAADLFSVLSAAGFESFSRRGVSYRLGTYVGCAQTSSESLCQVLSNEAEANSEGDFSLTLHGQRFRSASSELFGAIAIAGGNDPRAVESVSSELMTCGKNSSTVWCGLQRTQSASADLAMRLYNLEDLGPDYVYEGWLITQDGPITSGRFSVSSDDDYFEFRLDESLVKDSTLFVLTIEPAFGDDPAPADTHILAGPFVDGVANLTVNHPAAFGTDFLSATGGFILETPTSEDPNDFSQGIWFLDPSAGPGASLQLPELPNGWVYEGWVAGENGPVSTGRFLSTTGADFDGAGEAAGPLGAPPFPGQDFISPALDLIGLNAVISIEPEPDNSPAPFAMKPLVGPISDAGPGGFQGMNNNAAATNPSGIAAKFDADGNLIR